MLIRIKGQIQEDNAVVTIFINFSAHNAWILMKKIRKNLQWNKGSVGTWWRYTLYTLKPQKSQKQWHKNNAIPLQHTFLWPCWLQDGNVSLLVVVPLWSWLKYFNSYWINCHETWCRNPYSPDDLSDFGSPLTFPLALSWGHNFNLSSPLTCLTSLHHFEHLAQSCCKPQPPTWIFQSGPNWTLQHDYKYGSELLIV